MTNSEKTAVILAGGLGSRLHPYTLTIPKPLLPLGGEPIVEIVIKQLASQGFKRVVITLGYFGEMIQFRLGNGENFGITIDYVTENEPLGTAGSLFLIKDLPEYFLVMNGDLLTTFSFESLLNKLETSGHLAAIATHRRIVNVDYGVIKSDQSNLLIEYTEKPKLTYLVSMGIYALNHKALTHLKGQRMDMPHLLSLIQKSSNSVIVEESDEYWQDIGRLDDFETASKDFESDRSRFVRV